VGNVGLGEEHIHMPGHAPGHRVYAKAYVDAALTERIIELADFMLRLRDGHAVAGHDGYAAGGGKYAGGFFRGGATHGTLFFCARSHGLDLSEATEEHVSERTV